MFQHVVLTAVLSCFIAVVANAEQLCISSTGIYTVNVNLYAGELGYFEIDECPGLSNPTIGMEINKTYTFSQGNISNYYHPIGFAYYADGAHDDKDELEPGVAPYGTSSTCASTLTCPAPMYFRNGTYLGTYSNNPEITNVTNGKDDFGLDHYEPLFFHSIPEWIGYGKFEVKLRFDNANFVGDLFYFCHIHQFMSGRIKLLKGGVPIQETHLPDLPYEYDKPSAFDEQCGTFGLDAYQLPNRECFETFVCDVPSDNIPLSNFSKCINAMNCHMMAGMTTGVSSAANSLTALFIHQMVPHHQNAVNMAKALLKTGKVTCDDLTSEEPLCVMETILRDIIMNQNYQIQVMYGVVEELNHPKVNDCKVFVNLPANETTFSPTTLATTLSPTLPAATFSPTLPAATFSPTTPAATFSPTLPAATFSPTTPAATFPPTIPAATFAPTSPKASEVMRTSGEVKTYAVVAIPLCVALIQTTLMLF